MSAAPGTLGAYIAGIEQRAGQTELEMEVVRAKSTRLLLEACEWYMRAVRRLSVADRFDIGAAQNNVLGAETRLRAAMELARVTRLPA